MKFYNRESELNALEDIYSQCEESYGKITVLTGRRRVGKTLLAKEFASKKESIYFFVSKKAEQLLCNEYLEQYEALTGKKHIGKINNFTQIFELLLQYGINNSFVLIIDEFQEFRNINSSIYSEIQKLWDEYKFKTKTHVIFIGSIYSLMIKIFQNEKEPLYGRADRIFYIHPFKAKVIKDILSDHQNCNSENIFYSYLFTGGIPRYLEILYQSKAFTKNKIIDAIFKKDSFFIGEGKNLLIQEFGRDYGVYFSILELIASGSTSRSEIESILEKTVGGYLEKLEIEYNLLDKVKPLGSKKTSRSQKYKIKDNFIKFWFRFIYKYMSLVENDRFDYIKKIVNRDLSTFAGPILEKLIIEIKNYDSNYGAIGTYWEKGNKNEIDVVSVDDFDKKVLCTDVKLNFSKINIPKLTTKIDKLQRKFKNYQFEFEGISMNDIIDLLD